MKIRINNKQYNVKEATTLKEQKQGLKGITSLSEDEGMIFIFNNPVNVSFYMKDTLIPLDIICINEDFEVSKVYKGLPNDNTLLPCNDVIFVVELNQNSGVKVGDDFDIIDDTEYPVMRVLSSNGDSQMDLWGGERIISRRETKIIIRKAKKAKKTKKDSDYISLGKYIFKVFKKQDERKLEYVEQ